MLESLRHGTESTDRYHIVKSVLVEALVLRPHPLQVQVDGHKLVEQIRLVGARPKVGACNTK